MSSDPKEQVEIVQTPHRYVVVEGPIGVGKTGLARRLARSFGSELVPEQGDENPFLERFYRNPRAAAFQPSICNGKQRLNDLIGAAARIAPRVGPGIDPYADDIYQVITGDSHE